MTFIHCCSGAVGQNEVLGVSNIVQNLSESHKIQVWGMLPREQNLFYSFLQVVTDMTCRFAKEAVLNENVSCHCLLALLLSIMGVASR